MVVLSWNLFHGRAMPPVNRSLYLEFASKLAQWPWDVALLQEVPPWWPERLADRLGVEQRTVLTSRNALLTLRRAVAERRPELLKSNGGGCNAILARVPIAEHRAHTLRYWPERRVAQLAQLHDGTWVVNFHASTRPARAEHELGRLWQVALGSAGSGPLILGGDLNLRSPRTPSAEPAIVHAVSQGVDHLFARGLSTRAPAGRPIVEADARLVLDHRVELGDRLVALSDHEPLLVEL
ncbi:MAG TPA: endonuclease/exonuclease/phosphatase family protein [Solirubrobacteraceae bacterium]|nr:endonuclease/exonuclease/phosphatase family protein [Solirubrobacteraceae bacterium]